MFELFELLEFISARIFYFYTSLNVSINSVIIFGGEFSYDLLIFALDFIIRNF